jgi:hypothetical protein
MYINKSTINFTTENNFAEIKDLTPVRGQDEKNLRHSGERFLISNEAPPSWRTI